MAVGLLVVAMIQESLRRALVPPTSGALSLPMSRLTALLPTVLSPPITRGADEEQSSAVPASNLPKAVRHDPPSERAGKLPSGAGAWETGRTSVCARSPEGPGRDPGPSSIRRAAWPRYLPAYLVPVNFLAAPARP